MAARQGQEKSHNPSLLETSSSFDFKRLPLSSVATQQPRATIQHALAIMTSPSHGRPSADQAEQALRRADELMALAAILPPDDLKIKDGERAKDGVDERSKPTAIVLSVPAVLPKPAQIRIRTHVYCTEGRASSSQTVVARDEKSITSRIKGLQFGAAQCREDAGEPLSRGAPERRTARQTQSQRVLQPHSSPMTDGSVGLDSKLKDLVHIEESLLDNISFLPPVRMLLRLPSGYPEHSPPQVAHISADHIGRLNFEVERGGVSDAVVSNATTQSAMSRAKAVGWIRRTLVNQWEEGKGEIVFTWYETLRESIWTDKDSPLVNQDEDNEIVLEEFVVQGSHSTCKSSAAPQSKWLAAMLRTHDMLTKRATFEGERFGCGICLEEKRGVKCWRLSGCGHVFCQECLSSYLSSMIREGYLRQAAACPDPECVKDRVAAENAVDVVSEGVPLKDAAQADIGLENVGGRQRTVKGTIKEEELIKFVGRELMTRFRDLQEKAQASLDPSAGFCPRPGCERLVRGDPKDVGTAYEAMRQCTCGFTYCLYCSKAWHGRNPCHIVSSAALIEAYQRSAAGSAERKTMEMKYGKANLERMVRTYEEERNNRAWIEANTQKCPCCNVFITKSFGCNHMACKACNTHFCYRCGTRLPPNEPYRHFNTPQTPCYMKLFDADNADAGAGWEAFAIDEVDGWEAENL